MSFQYFSLVISGCLYQTIGVGWWALHLLQFVQEGSIFIDTRLNLGFNSPLEGILLHLFLCFETRFDDLWLRWLGRGSYCLG